MSLPGLALCLVMFPACFPLVISFFITTVILEIYFHCIRLLGLWLGLIFQLYVITAQFLILLLSVCLMFAAIVFVLVVSLVFINSLCVGTFTAVTYIHDSMYPPEKQSPVRRSQRLRDKREEHANKRH